MYFGPDGFESLHETLKNAKRFDDTIQYEDVRDWKSKQTFGQKAKPRGSNSFIASEPYQEFQCDLFIWPKPRTTKKQHKRATWRGEDFIFTKNTHASHGFTWVPMGSHGFPWVTMGSHGFP